MEHKFKVGDKVRCTDNVDARTRLMEWRVYTVLATGDDYVTVDDDAHEDERDMEGGDWVYSRFELVEPAQTDGWIEWNGGECPVAAGTVVQAKLRLPLPGWDEKKRPGEEWDWSHEGSAGDIIAYRIVKEATTDPDYPKHNIVLVSTCEVDDSQLRSVATTKVVEHHSGDPTLEKVVARLVDGVWVPEPPVIQEYTGGSSSYYKVNVGNPVSGGIPYVVECQDVIEALDMSFSEGNIFKAIWRICAAKNGKAKKGYEDSVYDLEKIIFFAQRELQIEKMKRGK